jgi:hypothetical protein
MRSIACADSPLQGPCRNLISHFAQCLRGFVKEAVTVLSPTVDNAKRVHGLLLDQLFERSVEG